MATIRTTDITKVFGEVRAVDGVNLSVNEGELLVILGPSGCGKTTLMRMIAGLERPTAGEIFIGDENVTELPPRARRLAMVFQSYALYPHKSVYNNIVFPLKAQGVPRDEWKPKVEEAARVLGIGLLLDRKPRQLSGGERQRVALARAMVRDPRVMLLDEPLSNLDAKLRASARDELQQFQRRLGVTTIFVTHDQVEAMGMGDRIVVMSAGKVRQIGTPEEIYHDSADTFVANFLGSPAMNMMERDKVIVGFRPENFLPRESVNPEQEPTIFDFHIKRIENLGSDRLIYGTLGGASEDDIVIAKIPSAVDVQIGINQAYEFAVAEQHLRFFDKQTGTRTAAQPF